jgi:hypothetical protein
VNASGGDCNVADRGTCQHTGWRDINQLNRKRSVDAPDHGVHNLLVVKNQRLHCPTRSRCSRSQGVRKDDVGLATDSVMVADRLP